MTEAVPTAVAAVTDAAPSYTATTRSGEALAGLMIDHEVGISSRTVRIPKIDSDYFEDEAS